MIQNAIGTAPITLFEKDNHVVISLPGVPNEMKNVMTNQIIPLLRQKFHTEAIIHKTLLVQGYSESGLAMKIADWENSLPDNIHLAYLPIPGITKLRLSGKSNNHTELELSINQYISSLEKILGNAIISYEDTPLEKIVGNILRQKEKTLATAESCTGGYIAHRITSIPGSSEYFKGTIVAYSNTIKTTILQVAETDLVNCGAVSKEVVEQMAKNVQNLLQSDYAIATSGVAGPDGGTENKPVGTIWISVCSATNMLTRKYNFSNDRIYNIVRTTQTALLMLKEIL
ncbi:Nicotinamide-nucleotide amidohydrolase PncC [bioreactor metagenome]|uniref:Nicotinamide-nucleotide amidohydrolase PncC n=1 Tax=bioreactor metagenome TaxID=1076179 RepID=A0A645FI30_9ZZZZ